LQPIGNHNFAFNVFQERRSEGDLKKDGKYTDKFENWVTHGEMLSV
jgi:hypothetical protein